MLCRKIYKIEIKIDDDDDDDYDDDDDDDNDVDNDDVPPGWEGSFPAPARRPAELPTIALTHPSLDDKVINRTTIYFFSSNPCRLNFLDLTQNKDHRNETVLTDSV